MPDDNTDQQNFDGEDVRHTLSLPETIGGEDADLIGEEGGEEGGEQKEGRSEEMEELRAELKELREERRRRDETINRLLSQQNAPAQQPQQTQDQVDQAQDLGVSFEDLPDPVENKQKFNEELNKRINKALSTAQQRSQQQGVEQQRRMAMQQMETEFNSQYPDLAKKPAVMRGAISEEANELRKQGIDVDNYLINNHGEFVQAVADRMRQELGDSTDDESGRSGSKQRSARRTNGVSGGSQPSTSRSRRGNEKKPPSFSEQVKQTQIDMGII